MEYSHEIIKMDDDIPFKMFEFEGGGGNYVRSKHWHRQVEMFAVYEGGLEFYINDEKYPLEEGDFIIVNPNELHSIRSPRQNYTVVIQIPLSAFEKYYTDERFIFFDHRSKEQDTEMMTLIRSMYEVYIEKGVGYDLAVQSSYYQLLYHLVTTYRRTDADLSLVRTAKGLDKLSRIMSYLQDNYNKDISLESLSKTFGYSPTYLSRMFQKYAQTSFKTSLDGIRIEHAKRDLSVAGNTIGDIAMKHGFANSKAFSRAFQARYGMLPSQYRQEKKPEIVHKDKKSP